MSVHVLQVAVACSIGVLFSAAGARWVIAKAARGQAPIDVPEERRMHERPTPRGGGIGMLAAGVIGGLLALIATPSSPARNVALVVLVTWAIPNGVLGWLDDHKPIDIRVKFAVQAALAVVTAALGVRVSSFVLPFVGEVSLGFLAWPFTVLWLIWMCNLFNFMDGMDAFSALCGAIFCGGLMMLSTFGGQDDVLALGALMLGGFLGFLFFNWPPARVFMGDAGANFGGAILGGMTAVLTLPRGRGGASLSFAAPLLVVAPFVWDATFTIVRRFLRGDPMQPHRTHIFQRLILAAWPQSRVRGLFVILSLISGVAGVAYPMLSDAAQSLVIGGMVALAVSTVWLTRSAEAASVGRTTSPRAPT